MPWINILLGKRSDEAMSGPGMLGRRCNRKEAEEKLQQSDECLSLGQRLRYTGTSGWSVLRTEVFWSDETANRITTWSNGRRKRSRFGNAIQLRGERSPHRPEVKRPDPRGSGRFQFSAPLQSGQHKLKNFPVYIPRMGGKRKNECLRGT